MTGSKDEGRMSTDNEPSVAERDIVRAIEALELLRCFNLADDLREVKDHLTRLERRCAEMEAEINLRKWVPMIEREPPTPGEYLVAYPSRYSRAAPWQIIIDTWGQNDAERKGVMCWWSESTDIAYWAEIILPPERANEGAKP